MTTIKVERRKKILRNAAGIFLAGIMIAGSAFAATNKTSFDPQSGMLTVSGSCSGKFVLVVLRRTSDGSIWGSSNPLCVKGSYFYSINVPTDQRDGSTFVVDAVDGGTAAAEAALGGKLPATATAAQTVTLTEPVIPTVAGIAIDTSSLQAAPDDGTFLDAILQQLFGIVTSAVNTVKTTVVAAMQVFAKAFTVLPGGSITVPKGQDQMAGEGYLNSGALAVFIPDTLVTSSSQIIVTPTSQTQVPLAVTQKNEGLGFYVSVAQAQIAPISFTWLIVNTYPSGAPTIAEQQVSIGAPTSGAPASEPPGTVDPIVVATDTVTSTPPDAVSTTTDGTTADVTSTTDTTTSTADAPNATDTTNVSTTTDTNADAGTSTTQ